MANFGPGPRTGFPSHKARRARVALHTIVPFLVAAYAFGHHMVAKAVTDRRCIWASFE